jgi:hypothetical protein
MRLPKDDLEVDGLYLPNIPIKITRMGDKMKFKAGDFTLELKEIPDGASQTYPLLLLDKFISDITTRLLEKELEARHNRDAASRSLKLLGVDDDSVTDNVIKQIHEDQFGGQ